MPTFYLIRHGERDAVGNALPGRTPGVRLTPRGRSQAQAIARRLADVPLAHVFSSPQDRAVETATPLAREKRLNVQIEASLAEIDFGAWTGRSMDHLEADAHWCAFNRFRSGSSAPSGESALAVQSRVVALLIRLRDSLADQSIACVSHGDPIRLAVAYFVGMPLDLIDRLEIEVGSISVLQLATWGAKLWRLNETPV